MKKFIFGVLLLAEMAVATTFSTPNMSLIEPGIGTEPAPQWAQELNADLGAIDSHDHTTGQGRQVPPGGLNINGNLSFQGNSATQLGTVEFNPQGTVLSGASTSLYSVGPYGNLYWNDGLGHQTPIVVGGIIPVIPTPISGMSGTAATINYDDSTKTFYWKQNPTLGANMFMGTPILSYTGSYPSLSGASTYVALEVPSAITSSYAITLPLLPSLAQGQSFVTIDNGGFMGAPIPLVGGITATNIAPNTITASQIFHNTITSGEIADNTITAAQIANNTITGSKIQSSVDLPGNAVRENGNNVAVSLANATNSLAIARGCFNSVGGLISGEGLYFINVTGGRYLLAFNPHFSDMPSVTVTPIEGVGISRNATIVSGYPTTFNVVVSFFNSAGAEEAPSAFCITAIGQR